MEIAATKAGRMNGKHEENYEERCNACFRALQYDKINKNKFSSGVAMDTIRLKAKLIFECTECGIAGQFAESPFVNVTLLHLSDTVSNHQDINDCMSSGGNSQIDYREQNTVIDPKFCEHCLFCPEHPEANMYLLLEEVTIIPQINKTNRWADGGV
jgi:hypothetical protein